ncbi:YesL family protein [Microlunatus parietis]|uniref:Putative membrane protein YesL n=1 Tax=Microlunatus parietis TaxID=682979 RepID=A0A7Y9I5T3_9ACTN|nr:YesL family protein [Microlunatus parietis]NYE70803.1 putative membrane protein YesL [Microlunatus parietis]
MITIFSENSPAMRFLSKLADLMVLNLLFVATSLPLITLGASLTALNATAISLVTGRYDSIPRTYLGAFRSNFRRGTLLGLVALGLIAVVAAWYVVIDRADVDALLRLLLFAAVLLLAYRVIGTLIFLFPYQATFSDSFGRVINNARRMSARHPVAAFTVLVVTVLPIVVGVYYPQVFVWGIVWLAFGFSGIAFVNAIVLVNVFKKYGLEA